MPRIVDLNRLERVVYFEDGFDFADAWDSCPRNRKDHTQDTEFMGGTKKEGLEHARVGNLKAVSKVESLWQELDEIETPRPTWVPAITGPQVVVPAALSGIPTCMRRKTNERTEFAPVRIVMNTSVSAGIGADVIRRRGIAAIAFANKLSGYRPVELVGVHTHSLGRGGDSACVFVIPVGHSPINLAKACGLLASSQLYRGIGFDLTYRYTDLHVGWIPWAWSAGQDHNLMEKNLRRVLGLKRSDVYLGSAYVGKKIDSNPKAWVESMVERYKQTIEQEEIA